MSKLAEELDALALKSLYSGNQPLEKERIALIDEKLSGVRKSAETLLGIASTIHPEDAMLIKNMHESLKVEDTRSNA